MPDKNITFEIREYLGVISKHDSGWSRELNIISWNGQPPKYDLRDWDPHHERMSRGITLHPAEMRKLVDLYLASNNRKAVEEGQSLEAERSERRAEHRKSYVEKKNDPSVEAVEVEAVEGATPPVQEVSDRSVEATENTEEVPLIPTESQTTEVEEAAPAESF